MPLPAEYQRVHGSGNPADARRAPAATKATTTDTDGWFYDWATQDAGADGPSRGVSPERARGLPAVWACVGILAEDLAKLPIGVYQRRGKTRSELRTHPVAVLLEQPNSINTGFDLVEYLVGATALRGNGYWRIEFDRRGAPVALWPLDPKLTVLTTPDRRALFYRLADGTVLPAEAVVHLRWRSADGLVGLSPIREQREALGLALSAQSFAARTFDNVAQPKGAVQSDQILSADTVALVRKSWEDQHRGPANAGKVAILHGGLKWQQIGLDMEDLQFIEQRNLSVTEAARIWRIPPHKIADLSRATFSNIEQQAIEYVTDTLLPWARRIEQTLGRALLSAADRAQGIYIKIDLAGVMRGDLMSRYRAYSVGRNWGWLSANDVRALEDMDPIADGDTYLQPTNMQDAGDPANAPEPPAAPPTGGNQDA